MSVVLFVLLFFQVVFCDPGSCPDRCKGKYEILALLDACTKGCRSSVGLEAKTNEFGVNVNCETSCKDFTDDALKSACYDGCTYIPPTKIESPTSGIPLFGILGNPFFSRIFSLLKIFKEAETTNSSAAKETHVRIVIPDGPMDRPRMMENEDMRLMMNIMHGPDAEPAGAIHMIQVPPDGDAVDAVPSFARKFCFRTKAIFHHIATHPLFLASIILMFVSSICLLILALSRLSARRTRRAIFQRQYRRMPGFFRSPSMRVSLLTPQPDDEAPELPSKGLHHISELFSSTYFPVPNYGLASHFIICSYNDTKWPHVCVTSNLKFSACLTPGLCYTWTDRNHGFCKFAGSHEFAKSKVERVLQLAWASVCGVVRRHGDISLAYGQSNNSRFVFWNSTDSSNQRPR
ncbi:hypothetical protein Aperf_G00000074274 [Anoplocephala perfoliata]